MKQNYLTIPINIYEGEVEIKGGAKLHPLHVLLLELIVQDSDLENIVNAFGLDKRIVQEAIVDLMYRELIHVDLEHSLIFVSSAIQDQIDRGRLDTFLGNEFPETVSVTWVQDTVTGQVMMLDEAQGYFRRPRHMDEEDSLSEERLHLKRRDYIKIQHINPQTLIKIAKMTLRNFIFEGEVLERVNRVNRIDMVDNRLIYVPLQRRTVQGISYQVPVASSIPPSVLEFWTKVLTEVDAYTISDLTPVDEMFLAKYDWQTLLRRWNPIVQKVSNLFQRGLRKRRIRRLAQEATQVLEYEGLNTLIPLMSDLGASVGEVNTHLLKGDNVLSHLGRALDEATELIIIGSSFVSETGLDQVIPLLEKYVEKGIKIILMWGMLGDPIEDLKTAFPIFEKENIQFIRCEDPFHSKFVIIDAKRAWITSCNLLSYWYDHTSPKEIYCELKGGRVVNELLEHARSKLVRKTEQLRWIDSLSESSMERSDTLHQQEIQLKQFKERVEEVNEKCKALIENPTDSALITVLRSAFDRMNTTLRILQKMETAHLITDLEHRKILRASLQNSRKAVRIGTDRVLKPALGPVIISALNHAFNRQIPVQVRWGREDPHTLDDDDLTELKLIIEHLREETKNRIEIPDLPSQSHAKFLTVDDHLTLVTSYNLFAFAGSGLADDEITEELGVVLTSAKATKNIVTSFDSPKSIQKTSKWPKKRKRLKRRKQHR